MRRAIAVRERPVRVARDQLRLEQRVHGGAFSRSTRASGVRASTAPGLAKPRDSRRCCAEAPGDTAMAAIDYYLFPLSPFSYLAGLGLEAMAARRARRSPTSRCSSSASSPRSARRWSRTGTRRSSATGCRTSPGWRAAKGCRSTSSPRHWPTNPVPASAAIIAAQAAGGGDLGALVHGFLRAVWAEDRDIADDAVVRDVLAAHGFDPGLADRGLLTAVETLRAQHRRGAAPRRLRRAELRRRRRGVLGPGPPAAPRRASRRAGGVAPGRPAQPSAADGPE